jgi:glycosyltransferase involved in cell wall biosynthesis/ubiquinone/menaquinone biosynthesis C-methylase UbiE
MIAPGVIQKAEAVRGTEEILVHLRSPNAEQRAEDDYFRSSEDENVSAELYRSFVYVGKALSLLTFDEMVQRYGLSFQGTVLELGGGYGYLSAYLKKKFPDLTVYFSDISPEAVRKSRQYEEFFGVKLDAKWVTSAEDTPFPDDSLDRVLFFASFHHVQDPEAALRECARILKPGGQLFLLFEPSCPGYLKPLYDAHVCREEVKENYYSVGEYRRMFTQAGLSFRQHNYTDYLYRRLRRSTAYYVFLNLLPSPLASAFPCSQVMVGTKAGRVSVAVPPRVRSIQAPARAPRLAVVCDMLEENWFSMDLVADMLLASLEEGHREDLVAERIRPDMRRRFSSPASGPTGGSLRLNVDRALNRFRDYPRLLRRAREEFDLFHIVDHSYAHLAHYLPPERTVVTCHDLVAFQSLLEPARVSRSLPFRMMTQHILSGMKKAARVVFDTTAVRDAALERGLVTPERARVVPLGVHPAHSPDPDEAAEREAERLLGALHPDVPEILHVGGVSGRKRIDMVLRTLAEVRKEVPEARLTRVGGAFTEAQQRLVEDLGLAGSVSVLPFLDRSVLAAVYRRAALVVLPSDEEGFGLPVLESMTCGTPVVASNLPVLREVGGDAAVYAPVGEVQQWGETVVRLLAERRCQPGSWEARRAEGLAQASRFTWSEYARRMMDVYQEVAGR